MAKKKKTLPKNFGELIEQGDIDKLKQVFDTCELDANGGYGKTTALSFCNIPNELIRWLIENGANIEAVDYYKNTALHQRASIRGQDVRIFLELGANVHAVAYSGNTALHFAAGSAFNVFSVVALIEYGADPDALNDEEQTPLQFALVRANNMDIVGLADISNILLTSDRQVTQEMKEAIVRIGQNFEFHRGGFNKKYLEETAAALLDLYKLYNVSPVNRRTMHDGLSPIQSNEKTWQKQYEELWELLVPSSGTAETVQGEVIRISGKVKDEINRNGGANWDADFRKMLDAFTVHLASGIPLPDDELMQAAAIAKGIRKSGGGEDDQLNLLSQMATKWVMNNPNPIIFPNPNYKR